MALTTVGFWELVIVAASRAVAVSLAIAAFWALRRTDPTVLKARIYMNHRNVASGLLFLGTAMALFFLQVILELVSWSVWETPLPLEATGLLFIVAVLFLVLGFFRFYSLSRAPSRGGTRADGPVGAAWP